MNSALKIMNIKVVELIKIYNFYFGHFSSDKVVVYIVHNSCQFVNNVTTTLSDEAMNKIKVVDLDDFNNFYVHNFFS